jgi:hypothetical protein
MSGSVDEKRELERLKGLADRLRGDRWTVERDDAGTYLISIRATGETAILATFHDEILRHEMDLIASAVSLLFRFFNMFDRACAKVRQLESLLDRREADKRNGDYTTQASILLSDLSFWRFLETRGAGGPVRDKVAADTRLKSVLAIQSKKQLNSDDAAKRGWLSLHRDFKSWKAGG